jgi:succinate dehydrogenase / fumarate reductase cytochrome b subunit
MNWFQSFLVSSLGQKIVMSLTGLFLMIFLIVHLVGNLQLLHDDGGQAFNLYSYFMTHNPLIKTVSYLLYTGIILHTIQGLSLWRQNRKAAGGMKRYVKTSTATSSFAGRNMAWLGILIFIFLVIHLKDFWYVMKFTSQLEMITYPGQDHEVKNLYQLVSVEFKELWVVVIYSISMVVLAFHLLHGFTSAFQTIGANHPKYMTLIKVVGKLYAFLIPIGFAIIPIIFYCCK